MTDYAQEIQQLTGLSQADIRRLILMLVVNEDVRDLPYWDLTGETVDLVTNKGRMTIGVGHNLAAEGLCNEAIDIQTMYNIHKKVKIKEFSKDLLQIKNAYHKMIYIDFVFNLGVTKWKRYKTTRRMFRLNNSTILHNYLRMNFRRWARQVKSRATRTFTLVKSPRLDIFNRLFF